MEATKQLCFYSLVSYIILVFNLIFENIMYVLCIYITPALPPTKFSCVFQIYDLFLKIIIYVCAYAI